MIVYPNAKINLYLDIVGKREDGYHELETLMVPVSLYDEMVIKEADYDDVICEGIKKEDNLVYKALKLFKEEFKVDKNFIINLKKNVPSKAGLGGGSSDAAFVIKTLCEICSVNADKDRLVKLAARIGSDVPFFIYNKPAIARGRGERLELIDFEKIYGIVVFDGLEFSTKEVFENVVIKPRKEEKFIRNDLEKAISTYRESSRVLSIKEKLIDCGCYASGMSGSGSVVFGLCETKEQSEKLADKLRKDYLFVSVFESL